MNIRELIPIDESECPFFFPDEKPQIVEKRYKIYNDGGHYIATLINRKNTKPKQNNRINEDIDILFDSLYFQTVKEKMRGEVQTEYIKTGIQKLFPDYPNLDGYIEKKIERKLHNLYARKKRFRRKANLNRWNYFVTFTYDDKKHTADSFRQKLRRCLSNLHTRRGWRYMGVFENAPDTGRLHFHGLLYIPDGEMNGKITEKKDYSTAQGTMQITHSNEFFAENFGRNDFEELQEMELRNGKTLNYLLKYIGKTDERIVYSRGIASEICLKLKDTEIVTTMLDFVAKYILFDDVVDWERDVMKFKRKQVTITDLLCNPPRIA